MIGREPSSRCRTNSGCKYLGLKVIFALIGSDRIPRALTLDEIEEIIDAFAEGVRRAEAAGQRVHPWQALQRLSDP